MSKLWLVFSFFPLLLTAQPKVTKTSTLSTSGQVQVAGFAKNAASGNLLMAYEVYPDKWAIDIFTPDLKQVSAGKLEKIKFPGGELVPSENGNIVCLGGIPKMLFYDYDKKEQKVLVYSAPIDQNGKIGSLKKIGALAGVSKNYFTPKCVYSVDSAYLLLICSPVQKDLAEKVSFLILNKSWEVSQQGSLDFPGIKEESRLGQPLICTDGSIWMPVWTQTAENLRSQKVWVWSGPESQPVQIDVAVSSEHLITSMALQALGSEVFIGGLYAADTKKARKALFTPTSGYNSDPSPEQGTFFAKIDAQSHSIVSKSSQDFSAEILKYWIKTPKSLENGGGIDWLETRIVIPLPDGNVWIDLEESQVPPVNKMTPIGVRPATPGSLYTGGEPVCGPAIAVMHSPDGKTVQEVQVGKRTLGAIPRHISHFFEVNERGVTFLYNDHKSNLFKKMSTADVLSLCRVTYAGSGIALKPKNSCAALYHAGLDGKGKAEVAFNIAETDYWLEPNTYIKLAPGVFVFACEGRNNTYGLLKVEM